MYLRQILAAFAGLALLGAAPAPAAHDRLFKLFADSDATALDRNPLSRLYRGDQSRADRIGDLFSDAHAEAEYRAARAELRRLAAIDRAALNATDALAYDSFRWSRDLDAKGNTPAMRALTDVRPLNHFYGLHNSYADLGSGQGAGRFETALDYRNNIRRHADFARNIDVAIGRFREGMRSGVVQPKLVVRNMLDQLDLQLKGGVEASPYYGPLRKFPDTVPAAERAALTRDTVAAIRTRVFPALERLRAFLRDEYLPVARDSVGLSGMPGGDRLYTYLIEANTTLPMSADEVHRLGLSEVARITREMDAIRVKTGFSGDLQAFFAFLNSDRRFQPASRDAMRQAFEGIGRRVDARVREQFSAIPKTALEIRPVPAYREKTDAAGSYNQGTPDGSRPGVFYYNAYDLPARFTWGFETLYLHEAVPGHHFQISLAQENAALPAFLRFGGNTAFVEGWALYAETLWPDFGLETDPYQRFGGLNDEMLRAMRLVVDSGLHAKGWSRDQAIAYMRANSSMSLTDATAEVERYIAIPGQALSYKVGQLTILRLKAKAKAALGDRFSPAAFHAQVLSTGALPMTVLEGKIDTWIAGGGR